MDIQKMIEEEAEKLQLEFYAWLDSTTIEHQIETIVVFQKNLFAKAATFGYNQALSQLQHANRWRKVSEELPETKQCTYYILTKVDNDMEFEVLRILKDDSQILIKKLLKTFGVTQWKPIE